MGLQYRLSRNNTYGCKGSQRCLRCCRLLTPLKMSYEAAKTRAEPYTKLVEELPRMRREMVQVARQAVREGRHAYVARQ